MTSPSFFNIITLRVVKWECQSLHTHTNPLGRLKWPSAITRLATHFTCGLTSALGIYHQRKTMVIHDTECPWTWVAFTNQFWTFFGCTFMYWNNPLKLLCENTPGVIKQHKTLSASSQCKMVYVYIILIIWPHNTLAFVAACNGVLTFSL